MNRSEVIKIVAVLAMTTRTDDSGRVRVVHQYFVDDPVVIAAEISTYLDRLMANMTDEQLDILATGTCSLKEQVRVAREKAAVVKQGQEETKTKQEQEEAGKRAARKEKLIMVMEMMTGHRDFKKPDHQTDCWNDFGYNLVNGRYAGMSAYELGRQIPSQVLAKRSAEFVH